MKLLAKTSRYHLVFLASFSLFTIVILYYAIQYMVYDDVDKKLKYESERINYYTRDQGKLPPSNYIFEITPVNDSFPELSVFRDTFIYEVYDEELIPYREFEFTTPKGSKARYKIALRNILLDTDDLVIGLFVTTSIIFVLMIIGLFFINQKVSSDIWSPFFKNLETLKAYKLEEKKPIELESSAIDEFNRLNEVILSLVSHIEKDFLTLKEFNENISHEMQTPLAIISNKMELLMESPTLAEQEIKLVQAAYRESNKLSKIGKSLSLISKIENLEFTQLETIRIFHMVEYILSHMEEMINFKKISLQKQYAAYPALQLDPVLANILFTNLVKNAIQHNVENGHIRIYLDEEKFEIENSGEALQTDPEQLFDRFNKGDYSSKSMGLGLAIARKISKLYGFRLHYGHRGGIHRLTLFFG